ncbi:MAG: serine--tRNA ligase [Ktedonobacteraceae bacterium]
MCYTIPVLNLDFICEHPDVVSAALKKRRETRNIDEILRLAEQRRGLNTRSDGLYVSLKRLREIIRATPLDERAALNLQLKAFIADIRQTEVQISDVDTYLQMQLLSLPNLPHEDVQEGSEPDKELRRWGQPLQFFFEPVAHWELGERLGILETEQAVKIAGSRFMLLKGAGARLERALISFMLDVHTQEHGYTEVLPPQLARRSVLLGSGQFPKFEDQVYGCEDELYLNPTAEVPLLGMHSDTTFAPDQLPVRYAGWTTAFRREAGSAARQNRGLLRLHQFNKIELFQYTAPQDSYAALDEILRHAEGILLRLELPYRIVALNAANLPFAAAKTFDIEVWMPGLNAYIEVSSISNCEAFQARRANIKYRPTNTARAAFVHTLNGSGLAVGRTMAAILETYQQADGSVIIPKVLRPYMGTSLLSPP